MPSLREIVMDPKRREQAREWQKELRARFGASLSRHPAELTYHRGVSRVEMALNVLSAAEVSEEYRTYLTNSLAEGLAMQGRFREAADTTLSAVHKAEYEAKAKALEALGTDCECPLEVVLPSPVDAKGTRIPARVKTERVFDGKNTITLTRCIICGGIVATTG
jgi:hypothetical protein